MMLILRIKIYPEQRGLVLCIAVLLDRGSENDKNK